MSSKKIKFLKIKETDLDEIEDLERDLGWVMDEFTFLNLFKCNTLKELLVWNYNIIIKKEIIFFTGDYFSCSILVKGLIEKDDDIAEIFEQYIKKMILIYAEIQGWIEENDY